MIALWHCKDGTKHIVCVVSIGTGPDYNKVVIIDSDGQTYTVDLTEVEFV